MGRSVSYLSNAEYKIFFEFPDGDEDSWTDLIEDIKHAVTKVAPSLQKVRDMWDGRETRVILANNHAEVGLSEYCGLVSLSIRVSKYSNLESLSRNWINQMWKPMVIRLMHNGIKFYNKDGSFSNGEGVYGAINPNLYEYNYLKEKLMSEHTFVALPKKMNKNWKRFSELGLKIHSNLKR